MDLVTPDPDLSPDEFAVQANFRALQETLTPRGARLPMGSTAQPALGFRNPSMEGAGIYGEFDASTLKATVGVSADRAVMRPSRPDSGMVVEIESSGVPDVDVAPVRLSLLGTPVSEGDDTLTRWDFTHGDEYRQTTYSRVGGTLKDFLWTSDDGSETELMRLTSPGVLTVLGSTVWHSGNDGAGSGLDADLLDGLNSTAFTLAGTAQPLDATLTALAALTIAADSLTIGTGADAFSQTTFAANTFPARSSAGGLVAKTVTDFGLSLVDDADATTARTTLGLGALATLNTVGAGQIDDEAVTVAKIEHAEANTILLRNAGTTGDPDFVKISDLTQEGSPAAGDWILVEESGGNLRKVDWDDLPAATSDLVFVATPADTAINSTSDVTIVTEGVTGVAAEDQIVVEGEFIILNSSGGNRTYTMHVNFDAAFGYSVITAALIASTSNLHLFRFRAVCDIRSSSLAEAVLMVDGRLAAGIPAAAADTMAATHLAGKTWDTTASDLTGTCTVTLNIKSDSALATQTLKLKNLTIRKYTP